MRGSLSTLSALLMSVVVLLSLLSTFLIIRNESLNKITSSVDKAERVIQNISKKADVKLSNESLELYIDEPPIDIYGVYALFPNGSIKELLGHIHLSSSSFKLLPRDIVDDVINEDGKIIIVYNGKFLIIDKNTTNILGSINVSNISNSLYIPNEFLHSYIIAGVLKNETSFLTNPIPGSSTSRYANYIPDTYVRIVDITIPTNAGISTVYPLDQQLNLMNISTSQSAYCLQLFIPLRISRGEDVVERYAIYIKAIPNYCPSPGYWYSENVWVKPIIYTVLPTDFLRTYLVTKDTSIMYTEQLIGAVAKSLYTIEYGKVFMSAGADNAAPGGCTYYTDQHTFELVINSSDIFNHIPNDVNDVIVLTGFILTAQSTGYGSGIVFEVGVFNITKSTSIEITNTSLINKPLLLISPIPGLVPQVTYPNGSTIQAYRASNIEYESGTAKDSLITLYWINATMLGKYVISLTVNNYPTSKPIPFELGMSKVRITQASSVIENNTIAYYTSSLATLYSNGTLLLNWYNSTFIYDFTGLVTNKVWFVNVTLSNVTSNSIYYLKVQSITGGCTPAIFNWRPVTNSINELVLGSYAYAIGCANILNVTTKYVNSEMTLFSKLSVSDGYYHWAHVRYVIKINDTLSNIIFNDDATINPSLVTYYYLGKPIMAVLNLSDLPVTIINK